MRSSSEAATTGRGATLGRAGLGQSWHSLRNRLLASPVFRRWAARFPLTRRAAKRHATDLFDLCAGFVYSQVLLACVRLNLLAAVGGQPLSASELARLTDLDPERLQRLIDAATSLELLESGNDDTYHLGPRGALIVSQPALIEMIRHHWMLYEDLRDPVALLKGTGERTHLEQFWCYARSAPGEASSRDGAEHYSALMTSTRLLFAEEVMHAYDFGRHRRVLDVGGGEAMWAIELAKLYPQIQVTVFDLPPVAALAEARINAHDMTRRVKAIGGDFRCDDLPPGADLVMLNRVLHDHDDHVALGILKAARKALASDATLMVAEPMLESGDASRVGAAYFSFYFLAMGSGRARSAAAIRRLLQQAGFARIRRHATSQPLCASVLTATAKM